MGYAIHDAKYADHVIAVTDNLVAYPLSPHISVPHISWTRSSSSTPRRSFPDRHRRHQDNRDPVQLRIAELAFELIRSSGYIKENCSFQTGGGGPSLAVARFVRDYMKSENIVGGYCIGGITGYMADMLKEGLFRSLFDVQSFDAAVTSSIAGNPYHMEADVSGTPIPSTRAAW
jgi:citrate lyase subunit alpha/citrate CoA-transferase